MNPSWKIPHSNDLTEDNAFDQGAYAKMMGKIGWLSIKMRPDIAATVSKLQRRNAHPRKDDMVAYKVLLQYLAGTTNLGIPFGKEPSKGLEGFVDSSYADAEDGKSTEAYIWFFAGALISWSSKRQDIVAASSTMAEYCALATAAKEGLYLAKIAADLLLMPPLNQDEEFDKNIPITLFCDSDNAITTVMNPKVSPKLSWISTRYHLIRDLIKKNLIQLTSIPSKDNAADMLTKTKSNGIFQNDRTRLLHMRDPN
ncbi:hypothetical protein POX_h09588 [Penicillium oxalicum]|uniref:hypothetical protein n=1 Tax=Penicillium oxalicum TaxID=69781 RepID=UPI0020B6FD4F|nr:hypothetical protein POX_h09588 [Penicillium oxalicum]KAI2785827.1 hypothetical protein POX_h09588 [Penicillium oxalicum]